jgi:hypothetical protein
VLSQRWYTSRANETVAWQGRSWWFFWIIVIKDLSWCCCEKVRRVGVFGCEWHVMQGDWWQYEGFRNVLLWWQAFLSFLIFTVELPKLVSFVMILHLIKRIWMFRVWVEITRIVAGRPHRRAAFRLAKSKWIERTENGNDSSMYKTR